MSDFLRYVCSIGGMACLLVAGCIWALARRRSAAPWRFIVFIVGIYTLASIYPLPHAVAKVLVRPYQPLRASDVPPGHTVIVLLGSGAFTAHDWDENTYALNDPAAADRVIEAVRVYRLIHPDFIVSSGGAVGGMDKRWPSGKVMKEMLVQLGVPESRILLEVDSLTTHDEAVIVKGMLGSMNVDHIVLVTSDVHMWRSVGTFRAQGMEVIPAIARNPHLHAPWDIDLLPSTTGMSEMQDVTHEIFGVAYYTVRGWYR